MASKMFFLFVLITLVALSYGIPVNQPNEKDTQERRPITDIIDEFLKSLPDELKLPSGDAEPASERKARRVFCEPILDSNKKPIGVKCH